MKVSHRFRLPRQAKNITGHRFGRLIPLKPTYKTHYGWYWLCLCDCGTKKEVSGIFLRDKSTRSCGCLRRERIRKVNTKHGYASHVGRAPEYRSYCGAKVRCRNKNSKDYPNYGGRGIQFKFESFEEFLQEIGPRPSAKHSVDRIDNDGHYEPGNVRWATTRIQANNRRNSRRVKC
jgi:hypothetical protein